MTRLEAFHVHHAQVTDRFLPGTCRNDAGQGRQVMMRVQQAGLIDEGHGTQDGGG
jgi:hypothetical protein